EPVSLKTGTYTRITGRGKDLSAHPGGKMKSRKLAVLAGILAGNFCERSGCGPGTDSGMLVSVS
ncbi:hypothetical protein NGB58_25670, partial [Escherichia coli]|nr:hypothetical protein [Escherichia coli]